MKNIFLLLVFQFSSIAKAQNDSLKVKPEIDILKTTEFKKGIYASFEQFKNNSPYTNKIFTIKKRSAANTFLWGGTEVSLIFEKEVTNEYINAIWGVCDGDSLYINNKRFSANRGFDKVIKLSFPYTYFVGTLVLKDEGLGLAGGMGGIPYKCIVLLDMRSGEFIKFYESEAKKLLQNDPQLMNMYNKIKDMDNNEIYIFQLIDKLNSKTK